MIVAATLIFLIGAIGAWLIFDTIDNRRIDAEAVTLKENLTIEFGQPARVSDFIESLNGEYIDDFAIDTTSLGAVDVQFDYINIKNKKRTAKFNIEIVDTTAPTIYGLSKYSVPVGYEGDLTDLMISVDNIDDFPARNIVGEYNLTQPGTYKLDYIITDHSGNSTKQPFTLEVFTPTYGNSQSTPATPNTLPISSAIRTHKTAQTSIGIDVSAWQGTIDWQKVHEAGVEFAFIRVGYQVDFDAEFMLDRTFVNNIEGALKAGLPVGVYFYSCANNIDEAKRQAEWILEQVDGYELELGIVFDWEEWSDFNHASMSFYTLEKVADAFVETVEERGYKGLLYGSKNYLNRFWQGNTHPVWLAQYYDHPTYEKDFHFWQFTDAGIVPGISGYVDLDVRYDK